MDAGRKAGPRADSRPVDLDERLVADGVAVVARRDVEHVVRAEPDLGAVGEVDAEVSGDDHSHMPRLAPLAAHLRTGRADQRQPGSDDDEPDREIAELHEVWP